MPFGWVEEVWCEGFVGFFSSKVEGKCVILQHAMVLANQSTFLPHTGKIWIFSYSAVIWKVIEHFIAILKINVKLKANHLCKHACSKIFWEISLKQLKKFLNFFLKFAPLAVHTSGRLLLTNDIFPLVSFVIQLKMSLCLQDCFLW